jgi:hypothetical protein
MDKGIGAAGAARLAAALRSCTALASLNLRGNRIGAKGMTSLAAVLPSCVALVSLNLEINNLGDGGTASLAVALPPCTALASLHLQSNEIGDEGAASLVTVLPSCAALALLDLRCNDIKFECQTQLRSACECEGKHIVPGRWRGRHGSLTLQLDMLTGMGGGVGGMDMSSMMAGLMGGADGVGGVGGMDMSSMMAGLMGGADGVGGTGGGMGGTAAMKVELEAAEVEALRETREALAGTGPLDCPAKHGLAIGVTPSTEHSCDICGTRFALGAPVSRCAACDYDACPGCVAAAAATTRQRHK